MQIIKFQLSLKRGLYKVWGLYKGVSIKSRDLKSGCYGQPDFYFVSVLINIFQLQYISNELKIRSIKRKYCVTNDIWRKSYFTLSCNQYMMANITNECMNPRIIQESSSSIVIQYWCSETKSSRWLMINAHFTLGITSTVL